MTEKPVALVPRSMRERKPGHGQPCNGCGMCCAATRCQVGVQLFGPGGWCPALVRTGEHTFGCGVVQEIAKSGDKALLSAALLLIRAGEGCDARFNGEPTDHEFHKQQDETDRKNADTIRFAQSLFGIKGE